MRSISSEAVQELSNLEQPLQSLKINISLVPTLHVGTKNLLIWNAHSIFKRYITYTLDHFKT